jgi:hypothetical protein
VTFRRILGLLASAAMFAGALWFLRRRRPGHRHGLEYEGPAGDDVTEVGGLPDDAVVLARVETELFRDPAVPKGDITIDVVGGVVTLRGQVEPQLVQDLPVLVAAVEGVVRVENLLRPRGTA